MLRTGVAQRKDYFRDIVMREQGDFQQLDTVFGCSSTERDRVRAKQLASPEYVATRGKALHTYNINSGSEPMGQDPFRGHVSDILHIIYLHYDS